MTPLAVAQIPAAQLRATLERSDFLIQDLKTLRGQLEIGAAIPASLAQAIETRMLQVLDELSPEMRHAEAKAQRYAEVPKLGPLFGDLQIGGTQ